MSFMSEERARAAAWKTTTPTLPDGARVPAPYVGKDGRSGGSALPFCLPPEHAALSLLPEVREPAMALFAELGIPWHAGVDGGPGNHLLSSQVQCVNALGQMVDDPDRLVRAFGPLLDVQGVLQIEPGRHLTFEYIGPTDVFGEVPHGERVRGARCTSVDAAFLHRAGDGAVELVLVEWKYSEAYRPYPTDPRKNAERWRRYGAALSAPDSPVVDRLPFAELVQEPLYQLVRQQLLAHELEKARAEGADRVRVVHVRPPQNDAYEQSLSEGHRKLGDSVQEVWAKLLRPQDPPRYLSLDSAVFADSAITSPEYVRRYGREVAWDAASLLAAAGVEAADELENALYAQDEFDGDLILHDDGVELYLDGESLGFDYPFTLRAPHEAADLSSSSSGRSPGRPVRDQNSRS